MTRSYNSQCDPAQQTPPRPDDYDDSDIYQRLFHQRWNHLNDPHVRALAWLLDSPDLLALQAPQWQGKIAHIAGADDGNFPAHEILANWLQLLDSTPEKLLLLYTFMGTLLSTRLGLYAEKLMAFYFQQQGILVAHGMQVRTENGTTTGEFDFLLRQPVGLLHWEFATKFYLLEKGEGDLVANDFIGPDLTDSLGQKIQKILTRQLMLSHHPVAKAYLTEPVACSQALIKGWLFYRHRGLIIPTTLGLSARHCHGYWCAISQLEVDDRCRYLLLPKQKWLAPAKAALEETLDAGQARHSLLMHFVQESAPVLLATLRFNGTEALESRRGFIVPDNWPLRAA